MAVSADHWRDIPFDFEPGDVTGAFGDSVTVLPIVVAAAALTDLSLGAIFVWFGVFQIVSGLWFQVPISVEPMKALAGLLLAGALTTGEFVIGGLLAGVVLLGVGSTNTLGRVQAYVGEPVVRGIQLAVALLLLQTGIGLGLANPPLAAVAVTLAGVAILLGQFNLSALLVLGAGAAVALWTGGIPTVTLPELSGLSTLSTGAMTPAALEATGAQLAMTVGNAAVATSLLLEDYFDRHVEPDALATSMGTMNLVSIPLGGMPMCHGSGGVAGKYAFGARTEGANLLLGGLYLLAATVAVGIVAAYPLSMLGVILVLVALQLAQTSLQASHLPLVVAIGVVGLVVNIGVAFVAGVFVWVLLDRR